LKQSTGAGHAWLVADGAGNEFGHFVAGTQDAIALMSGFGGAWEIYNLDDGARKGLWEMDEIQWSWSPDGSQAVNGRGAIRNAGRPKIVANVDIGGASLVTWSPDGTRIAGVRFDQVSQSSQLCIWNFETKSQTISSRISAPLRAIRWSPDGSRFLTAAPGEVAVWDPSSPESPALTFSALDLPESSRSARQIAGPQVLDAGWSTDGKSIRWATSDSIHTHNAKSGYDQPEIPGTRFTGRTISAASDGLVFRPEMFVRRWHFSSQSKAWVDRDSVVTMADGELERLKDSALATSAVASESPFIDVLPHLPGDKDYVSGYAVCRLTSPAPQSLRLFTGSDDALRIWLNGNLVQQVFELRAAHPDRDIADVALLPGENTLVFEITNGQGACGFFCRFEFPDGTPAVLDESGQLREFPMTRNP
jgi:WD40 repeat protein